MWVSDGLFADQIIGAEVEVVTFGGKHETTIGVFSTYDKAHRAKAQWYRDVAAPDDLPDDDQAAIDQFEADEGDYRAWISTARIQ